VRDWTQNPHVIGAIRDYEFARFSWLEVADIGLLTEDASCEQAAAFEKMQAADRAYVQARDDALDRPSFDFLRELSRSPGSPHRVTLTR
jgi:hypothetical protein